MTRLVKTLYGVEFAANKTCPAPGCGAPTKVETRSGDWGEARACEGNGGESHTFRVSYQYSGDPGVATGVKAHPVKPAKRHRGWW